MARKFRDTTGKPQNVLENEYNIHKKCVDFLPSLPSFIGDYFGSMDTQGLSNKTKQAYINDIYKFFTFLIDAEIVTVKSVKDITLDDIEKLTATDVDDYLKYIQKYEENGIVYTNGKASTARKRSSIVGLLSYLYRKDMTSHNISEKIDPVSIKRTGSNDNIKALQEDEIMELLDIVSTGKGLTSKEHDYWEKNKYRDKLIIELFVNYGLRITELQQLNISSFNFRQGEFTIYRKRDKEAVMPMNRSITMVLQEYLDKERNLITNVADGHEDALFLALRSDKVTVGDKVISGGRKRLSERQIRDLVKKYTNMVIGNGGYSPHKLRATAATSALRRGNDIFRVANLLDHDSVQTTQRYLQTNKEDKVSVVKSMEIEIERTQD